ncbi:SIS domain-containing protein [Mumia sp. DW29H23]|uniref:SIS domain-containing protein n=1 Tax=Mumia sp. DW29H23 TaxID=3421241 RepID=UPI003D69954D
MFHDGSFDDGLLDDERALTRADPVLRDLAESGARVRMDTHTAGEVVATLGNDADQRPRAVVAAGQPARLLRAVLEPVCPVPFLAWPGPGLPGWAGSLDLVVVLGAPDGPAAHSAAAEAVRRGCPLLLVAPATSALAEVAASRWTTVLPTATADPLATSVVALQALAALGLAPPVDSEEVARALDSVAVGCSPFHDLGSNHAKQLASGLGDTVPLVWGGSVLAARAARRWAEALRRVSARPALAAEAEDLVAVLQASPQRDVFADPFEDPVGGPSPFLVLLDDRVEAPTVRVDRSHLLGAAETQGVRHDDVVSVEGGEVARYASLVATGSYAAAYLAIGLGR